MIPPPERKEHDYGSVVATRPSERRLGGPFLTPGPLPNECCSQPHSPLNEKAPRKKAADGGTGIPSVLQVLFRSFSKLAERAAEGRPLFRGLRIAHDPGADRFVVVHAGSWIEFVLTIPGDCVPPMAKFNAGGWTPPGRRANADRAFSIQ